MENKRGSADSNQLNLYLLQECEDELGSSIFVRSMQRGVYFFFEYLFYLAAAGFVVIYVEITYLLFNVAEIVEEFLKTQVGFKESLSRAFTLTTVSFFFLVIFTIVIARMIRMARKRITALQVITEKLTLIKVNIQKQMGIAEP